MCVAIQVPVGVLFGKIWRLNEKQVLAMSQSAWNMLRPSHLSSVMTFIAGVFLKVARRSPLLAAPA